MATNKKLTSKAKYVPNRMINEIEVERNGRTTTIDGADLLDGAYVKRTVKFGNGGGTAVSSQSGLAEGTNADLLMNEQNLRYAKGGGIKNKAKYIPNRLINEIEVERNGRTTTIDGADLLDGAYVKRTVKFGNGGGVAVSSESGLAVGTNADLLMNQQYLQYREGGSMGTWCYEIGGL
jgi:hypothetical protein